MPRTILYDFQKRALSFARTKRFCALFMEPRLGKAVVSVKLIDERYALGKVRRVLIFCPKTAVSSWLANIEKHGTSPVITLTDPVEMPLTRLANSQGNAPIDRVVPEEPESYPLEYAIITYAQSFRRTRAFLAFRPDMMICDESHRIKNPFSRQSKAVAKIGKEVKYKMILTGSPIGKTELDLWAQFRFLDPMVLGDDWDYFKKKYTRPDGFMGYEYKLRQMKADMYFDLIHRRAFYMTMQEARPELPPEIVDRRQIPLEPSARKIYEQIEAEFMAYIKEHDITVTTPAVVTQMIRLAQITGGWVHGDDGRVAQVSHAKINAVRDFMIDLPKKTKVVFFARFKLEVSALVRLQKELYRSIIRYDGDTKDRSIWQQFQAGHYDSFVGQIQTGGEAIDLYAADIVVFFSTGFSWLDYSQARARLRYLDKTRGVWVVHFDIGNSIDNYTSRALQRKGDVAARVLDAYRRKVHGKEGSQGRG